MCGDGQLQLTTGQLQLQNTTSWWVSKAVGGSTAHTHTVLYCCLYLYVSVQRHCGGEFSKFGWQVMSSIAVLQLYKCCYISNYWWKEGGNGKWNMFKNNYKISLNVQMKNVERLHFIRLLSGWYHDWQTLHKCMQSNNVMEQINCIEVWIVSSANKLDYKYYKKKKMPLQ